MFASPYTYFISSFLVALLLGIVVGSSVRVFSVKNGFGFIIESRPDGNSWNVTAANPSGTNNSTIGVLQAHAECAKLH